METNYFKEDDFLKDNQNIHTAKETINQNDIRRILVPSHRLTPLKNSWDTIVSLLVEKMKLMLRMNVQRRTIEIKNSNETNDNLNLQRADDFLQAYILGFELNDAVSFLRVDDIYLETFDIKDIKNLHGDHLSRAIGRITGEKGKTRHAIENSTKTRIVVADSKISVMGGFTNLKLARNAISSLIMGSPSNKVYNQLRMIAKRKSEI